MRTFVKVWLGIALLAIAFGIGILIISIASGASFHDVPTYSMEESYDGVKSVNIQIKVGEVHITEGDVFHINADNMPKDSLKVYVDDDGTWVIDENQNSFMDLFGLHFSANQLIWWRDDLKPKVTITVPRDFVAEDFTLDIGAGTAEAEAIRCAKGKFTVGAGTIQADLIEATDASDFEVGTGEMTINKMKVNNITVDCGVGDIRMEGIVTGDNKVECGVGNIEMDLSGRLEDYTFDVDSGIGRVRINDESYHNIKAQKISSDNAANSLDLDNGVGNITVIIK
jgi:hypothetical protein